MDDGRGRFGCFFSKEALSHSYFFTHSFHQILFSLLLFNICERCLERIRIRMARIDEGDPRWIVEEREDTANLKNWHWSEKNASEWSLDFFKDTFHHIDLGNDCSIEKYVSSTGDSSVNNRRGRLFPLFEWSTLKLGWKGPEGMNGDITVEGFSSESDILDDKEVPVRFKISGKKEHGGRTRVWAIDREREAVKVVRERLSKYSECLIEYGNTLIKYKKEEKEAPCKKKSAPEKPGVSFASGEGKRTEEEAKPAKKKPSSRTVRIKESFRIPPDELFRSFLDAGKWSFATRSRCQIAPSVGGTIVLMEGNVRGVFEVIDESTKTMKFKWRFADWSEGSSCFFFLSLSLPLPALKYVVVFHVDSGWIHTDAQSEVNLKCVPSASGSVLEIAHSKVPSDEVSRIEDGWKSRILHGFHIVFGEAMSAY
jgi:activator of HSP90 ATPase